MATEELTSKRLFIHTFGCQMNDLDSDKMAAVLSRTGYKRVEAAEQADLILLNTCSIREKAEHKFVSALGRYRHIKAEKGALIGVMGCVAQQEGDQILKSFPYVDMVIGPDGIAGLPAALEHVKSGAGPVVNTTFDDSLEYPFVSDLPLDADRRITAFVTIMKGCDNKCTFCIVPTTRGPEVSRSAREVVAEVQALVDKGVREVTLLGQNVNSYGKHVEGEVDFAGLIHQVAQVEELRRIRFTTSHPRDLSDRLVETFGTIPKLCGHFHLPVQSGSNKVLRRMKRYYTREWYLERVERLREARPDIVLTTDFIVGFPGETDDDFAATMDLLNTVKFDASFSFIYSPRPGTPALKLVDDVATETKQRRLAQLQWRQREIQQAAFGGQVGQHTSVLVEGPSKKGEGDLTGRTGGNRVVNFEGRPRLIGQEVPVRITRAFSNSLRGELILS